MYWLPVDCTPHACCQSPARCQDSCDLPRSRNPIWKELEPLLAEHYIKTGIRKRHFECATLLPLNIGNSAGSDQHRLINVQPDNGAELTRHRLDASSHDA